MVAATCFWSPRRFCGGFVFGLFQFLRVFFGFRDMFLDMLVIVGFVALFLVCFPFRCVCLHFSFSFVKNWSVQIFSIPHEKSLTIEAELARMA